MRRLPSLTALRTFEAAARHAHFGRAAQELCVTDSAVSHQIRQLEEQLGVALFEREGRQVRPSAPARRLLHSLQQAFELILDACDELRDPGSQAQLRVAVTTELAQKWLVGRLADFAERHPQITLHLHEQPLEAQLPGAEMDLAIIYGTGPEDASGYFVRPLPTLQFFPVCSPGLFNQSPLKHPRDLARHCLLHDDQDGKTWNAWLATHAADLRPARHLYLGHAGLTMEAAARGQGWPSATTSPVPRTWPAAGWCGRSRPRCRPSGSTRWCASACGWTSRRWRNSSTGSVINWPICELNSGVKRKRSLVAAASARVLSGHSHPPRGPEHGTHPDFPAQGRRLPPAR